MLEQYGGDAPDQGTKTAVNFGSTSQGVDDQAACVAGGRGERKRREEPEEGQDRTGQRQGLPRQTARMIRTPRPTRTRAALELIFSDSSCLLKSRSTDALPERGRTPRSSSPTGARQMHGHGPLWPPEGNLATHGRIKAVLPLKTTYSVGIAGRGLGPTPLPAIPLITIGKRCANAPPVNLARNYGKSKKL